MKWFKHFSDSLDDPFIQELMDNFGHQGYVAWFGILEIIAKENGAKLTGNLEISPVYLKRKLRISSAKLQQIFEFCSGKVGEKLEKSSTKPKLLFNFSKEKWVFSVPKLLELKDNYIKDLQVAGKKPSHHKEEEEEEEKNNKKRFSILFEVLWGEYPNKDGRKKAMAHFNASVETEQDSIDIKVALDNYKNHLKDNSWKPPKSGSTWFNNWRDWISWQEPKQNGNQPKEGDKRWHQREWEIFQDGQWEHDSNRAVL